jgi:hypothetical protein
MRRRYNSLIVLLVVTHTVWIKDRPASDHWPTEEKLSQQSSFVPPELGGSYSNFWFLSRLPGRRVFRQIPRLGSSLGTNSYSYVLQFAIERPPSAFLLSSTMFRESPCAQRALR